MNLYETLPNFLIIGAAKAGTTTLYNLLKQHPQAYLPYAKEPKFFNQDANYDQGLDWYIKTYFKHASQFPARGEATPHYLYWGEKVAPRIQESLGTGGVKLIVIFRDPVGRAYSQYWMDVQREIEKLTFEDALAAEEGRLQEMHQKLEHAGELKYAYFRGGCYAALLQPYLQRFSRQQFHFLLQEDLQGDFSTSMHRLTEFLGIQPGFAFRPVFSNPAYVPRHQRLHHLFLYPSGVLYQGFRKIFHILPDSSRYSLRKRALQANRRPASYPPMNPAVEHQLRVRYREDIKQLEIILHRDLSSWYEETS